MGSARAILVALGVASLAAPAIAAPQFTPAELGREQTLLAHVGPQGRGWITAEARRLADHPTLNVRADIGAANLGALSDVDIQALTFLVLMQASRDADDDLGAIMAQVKAVNSAKQAQRAQLAEPQMAANALAAPDTPVLQRRRREKESDYAELMAALSNALKLLEDSQRAIIANIR